MISWDTLGLWDRLLWLRIVKTSGPQTPNTGGFERIEILRIISHCYIQNLVYNSFFKLDFPASMVQKKSVKIIVYDIELEQILLWKE